MSVSIQSCDDKSAPTPTGHHVYAVSGRLAHRRPWSHSRPATQRRASRGPVLGSGDQVTEAGLGQHDSEQGYLKTTCRPAPQAAANGAHYGAEFFGKVPTMVPYGSHRGVPLDTDLHGTRSNWAAVSGDPL